MKVEYWIAVGVLALLAWPVIRRWYCKECAALHAERERGEKVRQ